MNVCSYSLYCGLLPHLPERNAQRRDRKKHLLISVRWVLLPELCDSVPRYRVQGELSKENNRQRGIRA